MGASDWAGAMMTKMEREYGVGRDRSLQITNRVRMLVSNPEIDALEEAGVLDEAFIGELPPDLISLLNDQDERTVEGRWNALVRERGIYDVVGADALLYDPANAGLDPDRELVSEAGESITIQEAMLAAWREAIPIEPIKRGVRLGATEYRIEHPGQLTLSEPSLEFDQPELNEQLGRDLRQGRLEVDTDLRPLANLEFAIDAPRQACVLAIAAAHRYVRDHGGASRDELVDALEPETNHPLGIHGVHASAKGFEDQFRDRWWAAVVAPGLRSLSEIREPVHDSGVWLHSETLTGGFESEATVEFILDAGYMYEIAYSEESEERRMVGYHEPITRPSAKPLTGPPVFRFKPIVGGPPFTIHLPDLRELHPISLEQLPEQTWGSAIAEVAATADAHAAQIPLGDVEVVLEAIQNEQVSVPAGLEFVVSVVNEREDVRQAIADDVEAALLAHVDLLSDGEHAAAMAKSVALFAEVAPKRVLAAVPAMASAADSPTVETRRWLVYAFSNIAETHPEELLPAVPMLVERIEDSDENLRTNALATLGKIVQQYPDAAGDISDSLGELLSSDQAKVRANAAGLLGDIAQTNPDPVIDLAPELAGCLTAADEETRVHASITLLRAGNANPEAVRNERDRLIAALGDSTATVRANACTLIGNAFVPVPRDRLEELENDPDERVREQAAWALERIS